MKNQQRKKRNENKTKIKEKRNKKSVKNGMKWK